MAFLNNQYPAIQSTVPANGSTDVSLTDPILVTFNTFMDESTINSSNIFLEIDGVSYHSSAVAISVSYDGATKTATITPVSNLDPGVTYRIIVTKKVKSSLGVSPAVELNDITFTTTTEGYLPPPKLLFPSNESLVGEQNPTFSWEAVAGASKYEIQVAEDSNFDNIVWSSTDVAGTSIAAGSALEVGDNEAVFFHWRVRAYNDSATPAAGEWSSTWVFNNAIYTQDPVALESYDLNVVKIKPLAGETLVPISTRVVEVEFDHPVDENTVDDTTFYVSYKHVDGDPTETKGVLTGSIVVSGNKITFTSDADLLNNKEYTVVLKDSIASTDGVKLPEDIMWTYTSEMTPLYIGVELIRSDIGGFIDMYTDGEINKLIHDCSKYADIISALPFGETVDFTTGRTNEYIFNGYVRYETEVKLLNRRILEIAQSQGKRKRLGDLEIQNDTSLVPDINIALKPIQVKAKEYEDLLRGAPKVRPRSVVKGGTYPYNSRQW